MDSRPFTLAATIGASLFVMAALSGCDLAAGSAYRRIRAAEDDPVPPLYQGPLVVEAIQGDTPRVTYSQAGKRQMEWRDSSGSTHALADPVAGAVYRWTDFGPEKGVLHRVPMATETRAVLRRWKGRTLAQRLGPCSAAGEAGVIYRYTQGPNLKVGSAGSYIQACITPDGVVLTEGIGAEKLGDRGSHLPLKPIFVATAVRRGPLPPGAFEVPPDLRLVAGQSGAGFSAEQRTPRPPLQPG
jgi:hypothetical protein